MTTGTVVRCLGGGRVGRVRQPAPLLPTDATPIAPAAGLVDGADGGALDWLVSDPARSGGRVAGRRRAGVRVRAGHVRVRDQGEVGRRLAAVQMVATGIASSAAVAAGFGIGLTTLWRWKAAHDARSARTPG